MFSLGGWSRRFQSGFLVPRSTQDPANSYALCLYGVLTLSDRPFHAVPILCVVIFRSPTTPITPKRHGFGLCRVRSPLLAVSLLFSLPPPLRCFSSEGSLLIRGTIAGGLPHSDICGSRVICTSPQLFAAYHVLRRLAEPRHPPYALLSFLMLAKIASLS